MGGVGPVGGGLTAGRLVLKFRGVLPRSHGVIVTLVFPGTDSAFVINMTVEMNDVVDFDGPGQGSAFFQRLTVDGQGLGQEESPFILGVELELDDGFVGIGDLLDQPSAVEVVAVGAGGVRHVVRQFPDRTCLKMF